MPTLPDPLHPAIVHFPVVLILLGTIAAFAAIFWRKNLMPALAAVLLTFGALGAWVAMETGESDGGIEESLSAPAEMLLDAHEDWAKRTMAAAAAAAVAAVVSLLLIKFPRAARAVGVATALIAGVASYAVYETGHRGGQLVFRHGAGVNLAAGQPGADAATAASGRVRDGDED
jgi:uncharacterized membrane protein